MLEAKAAALDPIRSRAVLPNSWIICGVNDWWDDDAKHRGGALGIGLSPVAGRKPTGLTAVDIVSIYINRILSNISHLSKRMPWGPHGRLDAQ